MPCSRSNDELYEDEQRERKRKEEEFEAKELRKWLETQVPEMKELDEVGKLCHLIRSLGEQGFFAILQSHFHESEARQLAGWWESHKSYDIERTNPNRV